MFHPLNACVRFTTIFVVVVCSLTLMVGCAKDARENAVSRDFSNPNIDVRVVALDDIWAQPSDGEDQTSIDLASAERTGTVRITVGEEETGVNLVSKVDEHQSRILSQPDGEYSGAQELTGPMGTAFYSRGRYVLDGKPVEETIIVALHPRSSRALWLTYVYPADTDSSQRVDELIGLFSSIE